MLCHADPPGKPGQPEVADYDKDRAEIKWTHPLNDGGSPITNYIIEKKMQEGPWEKVRRSHISDQFTELMPCTSFSGGDLPWDPSSVVILVMKSAVHFDTCYRCKNGHFSSSGTVVCEVHRL